MDNVRRLLKRVELSLANRWLGQAGAPSFAFEAEASAKDIASSAESYALSVVHAVPQVAARLKYEAGRIVSMAEPGRQWALAQGFRSVPQDDLLSLQAMNDDGRSLALFVTSPEDFDEAEDRADFFHRRGSRNKSRLFTIPAGVAIATDAEPAFKKDLQTIYREHSLAGKFVELKRVTGGEHLGEGVLFTARISRAPAIVEEVDDDGAFGERQSTRANTVQVFVDIAARQVCVIAELGGQKVIHQIAEAFAERALGGTAIELLPRPYFAPRALVGRSLTDLAVDHPKVARARVVGVVLSVDALPGSTVDYSVPNKSDYDVWDVVAHAQRRDRGDLAGYDVSKAIVEVNFTEGLGPSGRKAKAIDFTIEPNAIGTASGALNAAHPHHAVFQNVLLRAWGVVEAVDDGDA